MPDNLSDFFKIREFNPDTRIINGGSDLMVEVNIKRSIPDQLIDISNIPELKKIQKIDTNLIIGAAVTYDQIVNSLLIKKELPALISICQKIASQQIRHNASLSGNIANASPVADMATALLALNTKIALTNKSDNRIIELSDFYLNYKSTQLQKDELIEYLIIPTGQKFINFEKSTKRIAVDISAVVSCFCLNDNGFKISFGGIAPYPVVMAFSLDQIPLIPESAKMLSNKILSKFSPISDVRGSAQYRKTLVKNQIIAHIHKYIGAYDE
jgi:CO/xanthine dehydrogenase FAD-binding subunit